MDRRTYLRSAGATGIGLAIAGCTSVLGGGDGRGAHEDVVLDTPKNYEKIRRSRDEGYFDRPIHGDELPAASFPAPLKDREVSTREFVGERHVLMTFIFTRCKNACRTLTANLARVQAHAAEDGFADDIALLPTSFDPEYDTPDRLSSHSEQFGADLSADNWFVLRPESKDRVATVIEDDFGVSLADPAEHEHSHDEDTPEEHNHPSFVHQPGSYILANAAGYVERGYPRGAPNGGKLLQDVETLIERW